VLLRPQVSPHEFMQAVMSSSQRRFTIEEQSDPVEFWSWLLNALHLALTGESMDIHQYRFRTLETQLQEGASGRRGASGTVLPDARGFRLGGFAGPAETPYCWKPNQTSDFR
jgi:hypothetical protein